MQAGPVGQSPPASAGDRKYRDKSSPSSFHPLHPGFPRSLGQTIRGPSYGWPLLPSLESNFRRGPKEGCSGERGSAEEVRGGGGAPSPGIGGKGSDGGRCREDGASAGPAAIEKLGPFLPASSPRASTTPQCPREKPSATPPQTERSTGGEPGAALARGEGQGGEGRGAPARSPRALRWPRTLPLATSGAGSGGLQHKEVVVEETPNR